jgi:hypothetical protein
MKTLAKFVALILASNGLLGCALMQNDNQKCVMFGFEPGTEAFSKCMMQQDQQRQDLFQSQMQRQQQQNQIWYEQSMQMFHNPNTQSHTRCSSSGSYVDCTTTPY